MSVVLWPYQEQGVEQIRAHFRNGVQRILYQLPTGGGKTIVFCYIVATALAKGSRVLILAHRVEILDQIAKALTDFGVSFGIIAAGYPATPGEMVQLAMVFTLALRLDQIDDFDLVVIDEAHHATASTWLDILNAMPRARVLGVSATPERLDGKGLGDIFEEMVLGPSVKELIDQGRLAPFTAFDTKIDLTKVNVTAGDYRLNELAEHMGRSVVVKSAVTEYRRICPGAPAIAFCVNIEHSQAVAAAFVADGWRAAHVDGNTPRDERRGLIDSLAEGRLDVLTNCGLISEGLDVPGVTAAILLRPTMSLALYLQQVGRALRPGKPRAFILDHAGNIARHRLPDEPRSWSLEGRAKAAANQDGRDVEGAEAVILNECDSELAEIDLSERSRLATMRFKAAVSWAGRDPERLKLVAMARGYKPGWVYRRLQELNNAV